MKRLMLLIAAGSLWLFLAAVPVFADGGPHIAAVNSGVNGVNADSCAGCHRAHSAQGDFLLIASSETALCLTCHGDTGLGATTDVESGVQYTLGTTDVRGGAVLGYLRGGGFVSARIGSGEAFRTAYLSGTSVRVLGKVPVATAGSAAVTSAHLPNTAGVVGAADGVAWGNGPNSVTPFAGPAVEIECGTCHNPHGNGQYRILNPIPEAAATGTDVFIPVAAPGALVTDAALPLAGDNRNYTIIQTNGGTGTLTQNQVTALSGYTATMGDYFRRRVPWNSGTGAVQRRAERPGSELHHADLCLVPDLPHAVHRQRFQHQGNRRDLHLPPYLDQHDAELHHVPRVARFQRTDDGPLLVHDPEPGRLHRDGRRQPPAQGGQPRDVPDVPRPDGDHRRRPDGRPDAGPAPSVAPAMRVVAGDSRPGHPLPTRTAAVARAEEPSSHRLTSPPPGSRPMDPPNVLHE